MPAVVWIIGGLLVVWIAGGLEVLAVLLGATLFVFGLVVAWSQSGDVS